MALLPGVGSFAFGWAIVHRRPRFDEQSLFEFASRHALPVIQVGDNLPLHDMPAHRRSNVRSGSGWHQRRLRAGLRCWFSRSSGRKW